MLCFLRAGDTPLKLTGERDHKRNDKGKNSVEGANRDTECSPVGAHFSVLRIVMYHLERLPYVYVSVAAVCTVLYVAGDGLANP